jgi:hypothetical protein
MNAPQTVMANFTASQMVNVIVPSGVSFTLNGASYTGPQFVQLAPGQYTLSTTSPQMSVTGDQETLFNSWSDGGALSHTINVGTSALSISGSFTTEYQLTATAGSGGTILPVTGFYSSGTVVNLTATANSGYLFQNWTGAVASVSSAATTVTLNQAETVVANFSPAPSVCVVAPANITAWWKGDGSANDETSSFNATLGGDVSFAPGLVGQAFSFDGTQSPFVAVPAGAFPPQPSNGPFSFETWFQTSGGNGGVILGQQPYVQYTPAPTTYSPAIYVGTDGNLYVEMFYNGGTNPSAGLVQVNDNQWHHVAVTYDGSSEIVYLDGANIGQSLSYTQVPIGSPLSYQLGTGNAQSWPATYPVTNNNWYTFNGLIDEPTVYSRALTAAEVLSIAQAGSYGKCDPVAAVNTTTLTFPSVTEGQSATLTAVVSNPGNAPLVFSSISTDVGDTTFTILSGSAGDCAVGASVQPNTSCNVRVQFTPQSASSLSGQITLMDNSFYEGGAQTIALSGNGSLIPTMTALVANLTTIAQGDAVLLTATVSGSPTPTGSVTFSNGATVLATKTLNSSGVATLITTTLPLGSDNLTASYAGAAPFSASSSNALTETVEASVGGPSVVSLSPNSGSGAAQIFTAVYSDPNGTPDLATLGLLINSTVSTAHGCFVFFEPATKLLYLENDGGTGVAATVTPGSTGVASNSQCTLTGTGSSYSASRTTGTLKVALTFTATFLTPNNIYLHASEANVSASSTAWVKEGTWGTSMGAPTAVSVSPNSGSGAAQTFTAVYSDPNGAADLGTLAVLFNDTVSLAHSCFVVYVPATQQMYLENDGGAGVSAGIAPGSAGSVSNSQCTLQGTGSSYSTSRSTATLNVALTFSGTFLTPKNVYLYAVEANPSATNSGWVKEGTWGTSAGAPAAVSLSPNSGSGTSQTFTAVYSDPNGSADLGTLGILFNTTVSTAHGCLVLYNPASKLMYLENDGGTALLAGIAPGSAGSVSNSQCTLSGTGSSYSASGNTGTLNVALSFTTTSLVNVYLYASESIVTSSNSGWVKEGTWAP